MTKPEDTPRPEPTEPEDDEFEVVAHEDDELPCGGFTCNGFSED